MKKKLISVLSVERAKDAISSKSKALHILLNALYQFDTDAYLRAIDRVDAVFDYILDQMPGEDEKPE